MNDLMHSFCFIGEHGGYSVQKQLPSVSSSVYSTLPHVQQQMAYHQQQQQPRRVRLSSELDLDMSGSHYTPLTTPIVIETSNNAEVGPICASSPKRSMSAFTTFGPSSQQSRSNVTTPMSPTPPCPTTGHLV